MTEKERDKLIDWLDKYDEYSLLWDEDSNIKKLIMAKYLIEQLNKILERTAKEIKILSKTKGYKQMGIGDTATDEAIVAQLYSLIH